MGLSYLSLDRSAETPGRRGAAHRLASQIGSGLTGVMYVLDEPSIGLHQRDNDRLIATLQHLRDIGNSVIVVEHDEDMMRAADHVIDMGPGAGVHGGRVMAQGTYDEVRANAQSLTGQYLSGTRTIAVPKRRTPWLPCWTSPRRSSRPKPNRAFHKPRPASAAPNAWPNTTHARAPCMRCAWWVPRQQFEGRDGGLPRGAAHLRDGRLGPGKSTLVNDTLYAAVARQIHRAHEEPAEHEEIVGIGPTSTRSST